VSPAFDNPSYLELLWRSIVATSASEWVFYTFAALALASAIATMTRKNLVVAAVWLVTTFFSVAVCYVLLVATFLAAIQVLVYAGAVMVLFVFVIMVLDVDETGRTTPKKPSRIGVLGYYGAIVASVGFLVWIMVGTLARQYVTPGAELEPGSDFGTADGVGRELFTHYLFAFEAVSMLLLAAVIGAVVVARSRREREREAVASGMAGEALHAAGLTGDVDRHAVGPTPQMDFGAPSATGHDGGT
jgi:NADH-quinone oxidoreductase subunit J